MKKIYNILLLAVISMTIVSCDTAPYYLDTPPYIDRIMGCWESYYGFDCYGEYDIWGSDVVRYDFYSNSTGRLIFYSYYGLTYISFEWETNGSQLSIWYSDGGFENLYYGFNDYGDLVLSYTEFYHEYEVFRPADYYFEQGKSIDPARAKCFDPATDERPKQAIMKERASTFEKTNS